MRRFFESLNRGPQVPYFVTERMVDKAKIVELVKEQLDDGMFLVDVAVSAANMIHIFIDSYDGLTIEHCVRISRHIEGNLDREKEDFGLQVSSPGLTEVFRVKEQYLKNKGRQLEIVTTDGEKITGLLKETMPESIVIETTRREKIEGRGKSEQVVKERQIDYGDINSAKVVVSFK